MSKTQRLSINTIIFLCIAVLSLSILCKLIATQKPRAETSTLVTGSTHGDVRSMVNDNKVKDNKNHPGMHNTFMSITEFGAIPDDGIDDLYAIQNAINIANKTGGGTILIPEGTFIVSSHITLKSNVTLQGVGYSSIIRAEFPIPRNRIITSSDSVQQKNIILRNFAVDRTHHNTQHGILLGGVKNIDINNVYVFGPSSPSVACGAIGISPFDSFANIKSENVNIRNCLIRKPNNFGIQIGNAKNVSITNNTIVDSFREAIGLEGYDNTPLTDPAGLEDVSVTGNTIFITENSNNADGTIGPSILAGGAGSGGYVKNVSITGNILVGTEVVPFQDYTGIEVIGSHSLYAKNITISGNTILNMNGSGIHIGKRGYLTKNVNVIGNVISNSNLGLAPNCPAIGLHNITKSTILSNLITGSTHAYVIKEAVGADYNTFFNNTGDNGSVDNIMLAGSNSIKSGNRIFYRRLNLQTAQTPSIEARGVH